MRGIAIMRCSCPSLIHVIHGPDSVTRDGVLHLLHKNWNSSLVDFPYHQSPMGCHIGSLGFSQSCFYSLLWLGSHSFYRCIEKLARPLEKSFLTRVRVMARTLAAPANLSSSPQSTAALLDLTTWPSAGKMPWFWSLFRTERQMGMGERKPTHRPCSSRSRVCKGCPLGLEHTHLHILPLLSPAPPLEPSPDTSRAQGRLLC